jgi:hypothetical protein
MGKSHLDTNVRGQVTTAAVVQSFILRLQINYWVKLLNEGQLGWIVILFFAVEDAVQFESQIVEVVVGRWIGEQFLYGG